MDIGALVELLNILIAVFAVFGLYCLWRLSFGEALELEKLISELDESDCVIIEDDSPRLLELLEREDIKYYIVKR